MIQTIDDVIGSLESILAKAIEEKARCGYFASLYLEMTKAVKAGIQQHVFEDVARMERLDIVFAKRYLDAFEGWQQGSTISSSWLTAFEVTKTNRISVMQHLLCGINAHINIDLGIAAAQVCPGDQINALQSDFDKINTVISSLVNDVQHKLERISLPMKWVDDIGGPYDKAVANFSIDMARKAAWKVATDLAVMTAQEQPGYIQTLDEQITCLARRIIRPGLFANIILKPVKWFEPSDPAGIIKVLNN